MSTVNEIEKQQICDKNMRVENPSETPFQSPSLTEETICGFWIFRGTILQKFANKKAYVFLYGLSGTLFSAAYAYFNGTITTMEKRFKIPSKNMGTILIGFDITQLFASVIVSYYAGKGHRPRWIAIGLYLTALMCVLNASLHFIYGSGEEARSLSLEYGAQFNERETANLLDDEKRKTLCRTDNITLGAECKIEEGNWTPQVILFVAQVVSGVGGTLYYALGLSYIDDNIKKSKTPVMISVSYFLRLFGPAFGYALASICLESYISPSLTPVITTDDPRWLGAWWLGWILIGNILCLFGFLLGLFPKTLPRAAATRNQIGVKIENTTNSGSYRDMIITFKRLLKNKILVLNNIAAVFYYLGYTPYWIFTPKYIETQYRQSASVASLVTGTVAVVFSAIGVLLSGILISKYKPNARYLAGWNAFVGFLSVFGIISYAFLGCLENDNSMIIPDPIRDNIDSCNSNCLCDYVSYSPVCGENGYSYISACHAGCTEQKIDDLGEKFFAQCLCIETISPILHNSTSHSSTKDTIKNVTSYNGTAKPGSCPVNCFQEFILFLSVMCILAFTGATGRASNFLVSLRCVDEKDKTSSLGVGVMFTSLFAFIPSPIIFGMILDKTCLVWGKTCSGTGNCWLYDGTSLRYFLNLLAAGFVAIGSCFDVAVWYYVKDLKIFDDETANSEMVESDRENVEVIRKKK